MYIIPYKNMTAQEITDGLRLEICKQYPGSIVLRINVAAGVIGEGRWMRTAPAGTSDLLACIAPYGAFCAIEVKAGRDKVSDQQERFLSSIERAGGISVIARDIDGAMLMINGALAARS